MGEQSMISERDAHSRDADQRSEEGYLEPIETEIPQVEGHCGDGENKGTDQERTGYPVDPVGRDSRKHLFRQRARSTSFFTQAWTFLQCGHVKRPLFLGVLSHKASSIVSPTGASFAVAGQRTRRRRIVLFTFRGAGGSK
jgi:hypothetical protein